MSSENPQPNPPNPPGALPPRQQQQRAALLQKLHNGINKGFAPQALTKLLELHTKFPQDVDVCMLLGRAYGVLGRHNEAVESFEKASALLPGQHQIEFQLGLALEQNGRLQDAIDRYELTLKALPKHFYAMRHLSSALWSLGRHDEAFGAYQRLRESFENTELTPEQHKAMILSGAVFTPDFLDPQEMIEQIKPYLQGTDDPAFLRAGHQQLARLQHHLGNFDEAFNSYKACKEVDRDVWDPDEHQHRIDALIDCWTGGSIPTASSEKVDGSRLIFIVGMPRSGTSLTEQMLAQLDAITPGGELNAIDQTIPRDEPLTMKHAHRLPITASLYTQSMIDSMALDAMKFYDAIDQQLCVSDKQPYNSNVVPLIAHMFPGCKIIHCTRDPLDCCFSCYTTAFSELHMQTHDLYWLGRYYADHERTMKAWHDLPEVDMIDLSYEELVAKPEEVMRRVVGFLGLDWDDSILEFHLSDRTVHTASRQQVRSPLYSSSVQRYRPYEHRLDELKRGLSDGRA